MPTTTAAPPAWVAVASVHPHDPISGALLGRLLPSRGIRARIPDGSWSYIYEVPEDRAEETMALIRGIEDLYRHLDWTRDGGENPDAERRVGVVRTAVGLPYADAVALETLSERTIAGRALRDKWVLDRIRRGASDYVDTIEVEEREFRTRDLRPSKAYAVRVQLTPPTEKDELERRFGLVRVELFEE